MLLYAVICFYMLLYAFICFYMLLYAVICFYILFLYSFLGTLIYFLFCICYFVACNLLIFYKKFRLYITYTLLMHKNIEIKYA